MSAPRRRISTTPSASSFPVDPGPPRPRSVCIAAGAAPAPPARSRRRPGRAASPAEAAGHLEAVLTSSDPPDRRDQEPRAVQRLHLPLRSRGVLHRDPETVASPGRGQPPGGEPAAQEAARSWDPPTSCTPTAAQKSASCREASRLGAPRPTPMAPCSAACSTNQPGSPAALAASSPGTMATSAPAFRRAEASRLATTPSSRTTTRAGESSPGNRDGAWASSRGRSLRLDGRGGADPVGGAQDRQRRQLGSCRIAEGRCGEGFEAVAGRAGRAGSRRPPAEELAHSSSSSAGPSSMSSATSRASSPSGGSSAAMSANAADRGGGSGSPRRRSAARGSREVRNQGLVPIPPHRARAGREGRAAARRRPGPDGRRPELRPRRRRASPAPPISGAS